MNRLIKISPLLFFLLACGKTENGSSPQFEQTPFDENRTVTFEEMRDKVLIPNCTRCHAEFMMEDGVKRVVYPRHPRESHMLLHMENGSMPPDAPPVSAEGIKLTEYYIEQMKEGPPGTHNADVQFPDLPLPPGRDHISEGPAYP